MATETRINSKSGREDDSRGAQDAISEGKSGREPCGRDSVKANAPGSRLRPSDGSLADRRREVRGMGEGIDGSTLFETYAADLDEVAAPAPIQNADDAEIYHDTSLEGARTVERQHGEEAQRPTDQHVTKLPPKSTSATEISTIGYLIIFSIFGTLARLGLQAIMVYPGAPVTFGVLWANAAGCLVMGFLSEDRMLFRRICPTHQQFSSSKAQDENYLQHKDEIDFASAKKAHNAAKKAAPLYIGLATGFCGSFTSFSSFIRDAFLALSNRLPAPINHPVSYSSTDGASNTVPRNGGYSIEAFLAVVILTISLSISSLIFGAHLAIGLERITPRLPSGKACRISDKSAIFLAVGMWLGAIFLSIFPPDRYTGGPEVWRGRATFALAFAPLGVLTRFYVSLWLNSKISSFPLGTFVVNVFGTAILGVCWDLQHVPLGGVIGCQVLQGVMDGYCGCLTTVSTWASELVGLRRKHAYKYGAASVLVALAFLVVIMGSMQWTRGFSNIACKT